MQIFRGSGLLRDIYDGYTVSRDSTIIDSRGRLVLPNHARFEDWPYGGGKALYLDSVNEATVVRYNLATQFPDKFGVGIRLVMPYASGSEQDTNKTLLSCRPGTSNYWRLWRDATLDRFQFEMYLGGELKGYSLFSSPTWESGEMLAFYAEYSAEDGNKYSRLYKLQNDQVDRGELYNQNANASPDSSMTFVDVGSFSSPQLTAYVANVQIDLTASPDNVAKFFYPPNPKPLLVFTFDDGSASDYTVAYDKLYTDNGLLGTSFIYTGGAEPFGDWTIAQTMQTNGWDIQCHSHQHIDLRELSESQLHKEMQDVNNAFLDKSLTPPIHHAYPYAFSNALVKKVVGSYRKSMRTIGGTRQGYKAADLSEIKSLLCDLEDDPNLTTAINNIDETLKRGNNVLVLTTHSLTGDRITRFTSLVDYAISSGIEIVPWSTAYDRIVAYKTAYKPERVDGTTIVFNGPHDQIRYSSILVAF